MQRMFLSDFTGDAAKKFSESPSEEINNSLTKLILGLLKRFGKISTSTTPGCLLDVGCGSGKTTRTLGEYFDRVIGVDVSAQMIELANGVSNDDKNEFRVGEAENLPVGDNSIDAITSVVAFHFFDAFKFAKENVRVLKPAGISLSVGMDLLDISSTKFGPTSETAHIVSDMRNQFNEIAAARFHPQWHIINHFVEKYQSIPDFDQSLSKQYIESEMKAILSLDSLLQFYLSIPFFGKNQEKWLDCVKKLKALWNMTDVNNANIEVEATWKTFAVVLQTTNLS